MRLERAAANIVQPRFCHLAARTVVDTNEKDFRFHVLAAGRSHTGFIASRPELRQRLQVTSKHAVALHAVLEAFQICLQLGRGPAREGVDHPILFLLGLDETARAQISEMLGYLHLGLIQYLLEVANAEWRLGEQMQNAQPSLIAQTFVDLDEVHGLLAAAGSSGIDLRLL